MTDSSQDSVPATPPPRERSRADEEQPCRFPLTQTQPAPPTSVSPTQSPSRRRAAAPPAPPDSPDHVSPTQPRVQQPRPHAASRPARARRLARFVLPALDDDVRAHTPLSLRRSTSSDSVSPTQQGSYTDRAQRTHEQNGSHGSVSPTQQVRRASRAPLPSTETQSESPDFVPPTQQEDFHTPIQPPQPLRRSRNVIPPLTASDFSQPEDHTQSQEDLEDTVAPTPPPPQSYPHSNHLMPQYQSPPALPGHDRRLGPQLSPPIVPVQPKPRQQHLPQRVILATQPQPTSVLASGPQANDPAPVSSSEPSSPRPADCSDPVAGARARLTELGMETALEELAAAEIHLIPHAALVPFAETVLDTLDEPLIFTPVTARDGTEPSSKIPKGLPELYRAFCTQVLSTNVPSLDALLGGGLPTGSLGIFEIAGPAGAGKSQLAMQLCLMAAAPVAYGGLGTRAVLIGTEGKVPWKRIRGISHALGSRFNLPPLSLAENVGMDHCKTPEDLLDLANFKLPYMLRTSGAKVVVVDSIAGLYRNDYNDALSRAEPLAMAAALLKRAVAMVGGICICVNQVSQAPDPFTGELSHTVPALGEVWGHCVETRLFLKRARNGSRFASVHHSSFLPKTVGPGAEFAITEVGVVEA